VSSTRLGNGGGWWRSLVAALLLAVALLAVYVVIGTVLGQGATPLAVVWQNGLALAGSALTAVPLWRWLRDRVHDLADSFHEPYVAVTAVSTDVPRTASDTAGAIAQALHLPWVEVVLEDETGVAGHPVSRAAITEIPVRYAEVQHGVIRVAERRPGAGLTRADRDVLGALAEQLALRLSAEQAVQRLAESRTEIVAAREEERVRIRRDLHDGLGPSLAAVQLQLKALERGLPDDDRRREVVTELLANLREISADLRRLVDGLRPPLLDEVGLPRALEEMFAGVSGTTARVVAQEGPVPAAVEVAVLRIAGEAVTNAVKHARATSIEVVEVSATAVVLSVADDGTGISPSAVARVGLSSMRQRAEELGGTLDIQKLQLESGASGTKVLATIGWSSLRACCWSTTTPCSARACGRCSRRCPTPRSSARPAAVPRRSRPAGRPRPTWSCWTSRCPAAAASTRCRP